MFFAWEGQYVVAQLSQLGGNCEEKGGKNRPNDAVTARFHKAVKHTHKM